MKNIADNFKNGTDNDCHTLLADVFYRCKEGSIVAFKSKETNEWYTGRIQSLFEPNGKYNKSNVWNVSICVYEPINPQWYEDDDKTVYYYEDITNAVLLENGS